MQRIHSFFTHKKLLALLSLFSCLIFSNLAFSAPVYSTPSFIHGSGTINRCKSVRVNTIQNDDNGSTQDSISYQDFTALSTNLELGTAYTLEAETAEYNHGHGIGAWIDYNQDGDFDDPGELIGQQTQIAKLTWVSFNFSVPADAAGGPTRLRVRSVWSVLPDFDASSTYEIGETEDYTVHIQRAWITTQTDLPKAQESTLFQHTIQADFGTPAYSWSINNGPAWLNIDPNTGELNGTPLPGTGGNLFSFDISVQDSSGSSDTKTFFLYVIGSLPTLPYNDDFENSLASYDITLGSLTRLKLDTSAAFSGNKGLLLDAQPGDLNWTTTLSQANDPAQWPGDPDYNGILEWAVDATGSTDFDVSFDYQITNTSSTPWYTNLIFEWSDDLGQSWNLASGNGANAQGIYQDDTQGSFVNTLFSVSNLNLPGSGELRLRLRWLVKFAQKDTFSTWIAIDDFQLGSFVRITSPTRLLPNPLGSNPWGPVQLQAIGGQTPYTWSKLDPNDSVWSWLSLTANGELSGTVPNTPNAYLENFRVKVTDANSAEGTKDFELSIDQSPLPLSITTLTLPNAEIGVPYTAPPINGPVTLSASGGVAPYTWSWNSTTFMPPGLTLNPQTGIISGTAGFGSSGLYFFTVSITDSLGASATKDLQLQIFVGGNPTPTLSITTTSLPNAMAGQAYSQTITLSNGNAPFSWSMTGNPAWLSINPSNGQLTGTPPASAAGTLVTVTISVTDSSSPVETDSRQFDLTIDAAGGSPLALTTTSLPSASEGSFYAHTLQISGGIGPFSWSMTGKPAWLSIDINTGQISGTPPTGSAGTTSPFDITVSDSSTPPKTDTKQFSLVINTPGTPLTIVTASLASGQEGVAYAESLQASGGTAPYTWQLLAGFFPAGINFNQNGSITGTPDIGTAGGYNFFFQVSDANNQTQDIKLSWTITSASSSGGQGGGTGGLLSGGGSGGGCALQGRASSFLFFFSLACFLSLVFLTSTKMKKKTSKPVL